jgi:hypothetical protein
MSLAIMCFVLCSLFCAIGFIVGRCFSDLDGLSATQECAELYEENEALRQSLADAKRLIEEGERAMSLLDEYRAKVTEAYAIEREDFKSYNSVG